MDKKTLGPDGNPIAKKKKSKFSRTFISAVIENPLVFFLSTVGGAFLAGVGFYNLVSGGVITARDETITDLTGDIVMLKDNKGKASEIKIHFDRRDKNQEIQKFIKDLTANSEGVNPVTFSGVVNQEPVLVPEDADNCSKESQIRYFYKEDKEWASTLKKISDSYFRKRNSLKDKFKIPFEPSFLPDYSKGKTPFTLEVWVVSKDSKCRTSN